MQLVLPVCSQDMVTVAKACFKMNEIFKILLGLSDVCILLSVFRVSPSDADSTVSEESSERDAGEKTPATAHESKAHRAPQSGLSLSFLPVLTVVMIGVPWGRGLS